MGAPTKTASELAAAVTLRQAGYSLAAIAERTGISVATLQRHFTKLGVRKHEATNEIIEQARQDMLDLVRSSDCIRKEAAAMLADDLAHTRMLRARMAAALEHFEATDLESAALLMRAAAAYSTALKNGSDMVRVTLGADKLVDPVDLPALDIRELTPEEIAEIRRQQTTGSVTDESLVDEDDLIEERPEEMPM